MNRHDRDARRLIVCPTRDCHHDKAHLYRNADGSVTAACAGCGAEILRSQAQEAATA